MFVATVSYHVKRLDNCILFVTRHLLSLAAKSSRNGGRDGLVVIRVHHIELSRCWRLSHENLHLPFPRFTCPTVDSHGQFVYNFVQQYPLISFANLHIPLWFKWSAKVRKVKPQCSTSTRSSSIDPSRGVSPRMGSYRTSRPASKRFLFLGVGVPLTLQWTR